MAGEDDAPRCGVEPSSTSSSSSKATKGRRRELPPEAVSVLKEWLLSPEHFSNPYPSREEEEELIEKTGMEKKQLKNWFINARRRIWKPMKQKMEEEKQGRKEISTITKGQTNKRVLVPILPAPTPSSSVSTPSPLSSPGPPTESELLADLVKRQQEDLLAKRSKSRADKKNTSNPCINVDPDIIENDGNATPEITNEVTSKSIKELMQDDKDFQEVLSWMRDGFDGNDDETETPTDNTEGLITEENPALKRRRVVFAHSVYFEDSSGLPVSPLPNWMPVFDEGTQTYMEYAAALGLPLFGTIYKFSDVGFGLTLVLVAVHSLFCYITNFNPDQHIQQEGNFKKNGFQRWLPPSEIPIIPPLAHIIWVDSAVVAFVNLCICLFPEHFGPTPYLAAFTILSVSMCDSLLNYHSIILTQRRLEIEEKGKWESQGSQSKKVN